MRPTAGAVYGGATRGGAQMAAHCVQCGNEVPPGAKFCPVCGRPSTVQDAAPDPWSQQPSSTWTPPASAPPPQRNWFLRHKVLTGLGALVVLVIIGAAAGGGNQPEPTPTLPILASAPAASVPTLQAPVATPAPTYQRPSTLFPGRPDSQRKDEERNLGESATIDDMEATVTSAGFVQSLDQFETEGYIVANVSLKNVGSDSHSYSYFDWRIQTPHGRVDDPTISGAEGTLGSGDLVAGGTTSGKVIFEVGAERGDFYLLWKPQLIDSSRGVWKVTI